MPFFRRPAKHTAQLDPKLLPDHWPVSGEGALETWAGGRGYRAGQNAEAGLTLCGEVWAGSEGHPTFPLGTVPAFTPSLGKER
jgi:hypothetical protein